MTDFSHDVPQFFDPHRSRGGVRCMHYVLLILALGALATVALIVWRMHV